MQSLLFPRDRFTPSSAKAWAKKHGYRTGKVDVTAEHVRLRQASPSSFKRMRTIKMGRDVKAVVGWTR